MTSSRRQSAFSVYAETKVDEPIQLENNSKKSNGKHNYNKVKKSQNNHNHIVPSREQHKFMSSNNKDLKAVNAGVAKRKVELNTKKEKNKFAKLPIETINESIKMFNNGKANANNIKKKAFTPNNTSKPQPIVLNEKDFKKLFKQEIKKETKILKEIEDDNADILIDEEMFDSRKEAINVFKEIINPVTNKEFFKVYWEKKPMLIKRDDSTYYKNWFSCKELNSILRNHNLEFTQNIDITTYVNGVKQNHNSEGRAFAPLVWDFFQQGCSVRLLNPQTYSKNIWQYLSTLQELFGTCVGANVYLTPRGTQGFAPHYDDIEAFVLQLEGKKRWRVYNPISKEETLPRFSSKNFEQSEIGEPIIDVILEPGDLLYFPRGYIHQAHACDDIHSLHITVSCYQKNSWGDFLLKLIPGAVEVAMQESVEFRRGLPINYLVNNGVAFDSDELKKDFVNKTANLLSKLIRYAPIDSAVDQMSKQFLHDSLPPCLTESEKSRSIHGNGEKWNSEKNRVDNVTEIEPDSAIKLIRKNCLRLVVEENSCRVYHNLGNTRIYQEAEPQYLEVETDIAPAVEHLIKMYPNYITVEELPLKTIEEKIVVASCLYDKGLLVTGEPLISNSDSDCGETDEDETNEDSEMSNGESVDDNQDIIDDDEDEDIENDEDGEEEEDDENGFNSEDYDKDEEDDDDEEEDNEENGDDNDDDEEDGDDNELESAGNSNGFH